MKRKKRMIGARQRRTMITGILTLQNLIYLKELKKRVKLKKARTMILV
jgi:hypothetical protein